MQKPSRSAVAQPEHEISLRRQLPRTVLYLTALALSVLGPLMAHDVGVDSHAYWLAWRRPMYTTGPLTKDAFLYSPAFAQLVWPAAQLSWPVFALLFVTIDAALLAWLLRPLRWWALPIAIVLTPEILGGNIFIPLAAMAVLGFRYPGAWAFSALTKVAPTVMPLWWLVRREWRPLCFWAATTAAVVVISLAVRPSLWVQWAMHMATWATESGRRLGAPLIPPLLYRAPVGVALLLVGARKGWRWTVPVAALCCTPVVWLGSYAWLTAIPRIQADSSATPEAHANDLELGPSEAARAT